MDEYTFILLAKLKADRAKLEREQRAALWLERMPDEGPIAVHRRPAASEARPRRAAMREPS